MQQPMNFKSGRMSLSDLSKAASIPLPPVAARKENAPSAPSPAAPAAAPAPIPSRQQTYPLKPALYSLRNVFGLEGVDEKYMLPGVEPGHPHAPQPNPDYVFKRSDLRDLMVFWEDGLTALKLEGDPSTGKSSIVSEFHARLNWPLYILSASEDTDTRQIFGQLLPDTNGNLVWVDGPALRAAREGTSFCVDEWNLLNPNVGSSLNLLAEGKPYQIPETGEVVRPKKGFRLFATENPIDSRLMVTGRNVQDVASDDRFMIIKTDYMAAEDEIKVVEKAILSMGIVDRLQGKERDEFLRKAEMVAKQVVRIANDTRAAFRDEKNTAIDRPMSTRTCIRWARLIVRYGHIKKEEGGPAIYALRRAMRMSSTMATAVEDFTRAALGTSGS